jgi:hypothetical protein
VPFNFLKSDIHLQRVGSICFYLPDKTTCAVYKDKTFNTV